MRRLKDKLINAGVRPFKEWIGMKFLPADWKLDSLTLVTADDGKCIEMAVSTDVTRDPVLVTVNGCRVTGSGDEAELQWTSADLGPIELRVSGSVVRVGTTQIGQGSVVPEGGIPRLVRVALA